MSTGAIVGAAGPASAVREFAVDDVRKEAALQAYSLCRTVSGAARAAGIDRKTFYNWLRADSAFRDATANIKRTINEEREAQIASQLEQERRYRVARQHARAATSDERHICLSGGGYLTRTIAIHRPRLRESLEIGMAHSLRLAVANPFGSIGVGASLPLHVAAFDAQGKLSGTGISFISTAPSVVRLSSSKVRGAAKVEVVGVSLGSATIVATAEDDPELRASVTLAVIE